MHSQSSGKASAQRSDPLAGVIALLRPQTVLSKVVSGRGRLGVRYPAHEHPAFCLLLEGRCHLDAQGVGSIELDDGDFVFFPATPGFTLSSDRSVKPSLPSLTPGKEMRHGVKEGPPTMRMLGGHFRFDRANAALLVKFLPAVVLIRRAEAGADRLRRVVELIADETSESRPAGALIQERLVEVLLFEAFRIRPTEVAREQGLLAGLADAGLARALRDLHEDVAHPWTVAELARAAGMSRAVFAERFMKRVGMPPMQYVLEWRIAIAKDVLRRERAPLAEIAAQIGYQSASAFSTAFSRHTGCSPSVFARGSD